MGRDTKIQWCDSTVNPTMGCDGCELWNDKIRTCYAGVIHERYKGQKGFAPRFEKVTNFPGRMAKAAAWSDLTGKPRPDKPWLDGMPRLIFVSDMSDALSASVSFDYLRTEIIDVVKTEKGQRHCWLWLTKRVRRMAKFSDWLNSDWPQNLWVGTSVTDERNLPRLHHLEKVGDFLTIRFASLEPQIGSIALFASSRWSLSLVIQGGESGPKARRFDIRWAQDVRDECEAEGIPYFLKQVGARPMISGRRITLNDNHGGDWSEWTADLCVRQMPQFP